tara:strand:- start:386 stop:817 length:432 start_codon:yes stop_codon:yes gene_type:complete
MSRRVLLGKGGSDYGLFISKIGVDVVDNSGNLCNNDLMIFDSREKGYTQVIKKGTIDVARGVTNDPIPFTSTGIAIPNAVVIIYADGNYIELTSVSTTSFLLHVPNTYPTVSSFGYSVFGSNTTGNNTPTTTTVNYIVLRGYA